MDAFFNWLTGNPLATLTIAGMATSVTVLYVVAFFQGRSVSFWPPRIGGRPLPTVPNPDKPQIEVTPPDTSPESSGAFLLKRGSILSSETDKLTVEETIYSSGRATVLRAVDGSAHSVAVKLFWRGVTGDAELVKEFNVQQKIAASFKHRNIVVTFGQGTYVGHLFTVMEYFAGGTLQRWLRSHDHIRGVDILSIAEQIADGLDHMHSLGVMHRDIKPSNILFESDLHGRIALGDFGTARVFGAVESYSSLAGSPSIVGTPAYLAPEAITAGSQLDKTADIYSFGVVLFEMITGHLPFLVSDNMFTILQEKMTQEPPEITSFRSDVPKKIAARLAQTLQRDRLARPTSARAVITGIETAIAKL